MIPKIAFLAPPSGIGGGNKKLKIYYDNIDRKTCKVYYIILSKSDSAIKKNSDGTIEMAESQIVDFLLENKINFFYNGNTLSKETLSGISKLCFILYNINFAPGYAEKDKVYNHIISKSLFTKIRLLHGRELKNSFVLYNPIEVEKWSALRKGDKISNKILKNKKLILGRIARAEPSKWDYLIINTLIQLDKRRNYNYGFIFAGMPLFFRLYLKCFLSKEMLSSILFLPETNNPKNIAKFYRSIDLFWQTSKAGETFGNAIAESFCFGKPVISDCKDFISKNGIRIDVDNSQTELVDHRINGVVFYYPSKIIDFLDTVDKKTLVEYGKNGRAKVVTNYDTKLVCKNLVKVLRNIMSKSKYCNQGISPSHDEVELYIKDYTKKMKSITSENILTRKELASFKLNKTIWGILEFFYLVVRKILRIVGLDLESGGYNVRNSWDNI